MILGLLAIPVLSVTATALLADIASTTDPAAAAVGVPAVLGGVVTGALVFRLGRSIHSGVVDAWATLLAAFAAAVTVVDATVAHLAPALGHRPGAAFIPADVGRRGPPFVSR